MSSLPFIYRDTDVGNKTQSNYCIISCIPPHNTLANFPAPSSAPTILTPVSRSVQICSVRCSPVRLSPVSPVSPHLSWDSPRLQNRPARLPAPTVGRGEPTKQAHRRGREVRGDGGGSSVRTNRHGGRGVSGRPALG